MLPSQKQIEFAKKIANKLEIKPPETTSFYTVSKFIADNMNKYKRECQRIYVKEEEEWNSLICL